MTPPFATLPRPRPPPGPGQLGKEGAAPPQGAASWTDDGGGTCDTIEGGVRGQCDGHGGFVSNDQHGGGRTDVIAADGTTGDVQRWTTRERVFFRQPRLVPTNVDAPEGHGWLLVPAYTPRDTRLMIFDAARVAEGPVAVVSAGLRLPYTNHGCVQ